MVDPEFAHADSYEPAIPKPNPRFSLLGLVGMSAAFALMFSFFALPSYLTFYLGMVGFVGLLLHFGAWLATERMYSWQRQFRRRRDAHPPGASTSPSRLKEGRTR